jgi:hypothetical protein
MNACYQHVAIVELVDTNLVLQIGDVALSLEKMCCMLDADVTD